MTATTTWTAPDGTPLKFQRGDYVRIDTTDRPDRAHTLPFLSGYVQGYDLLEQSDGTWSVAYELHKMGHNPLCYVREKFLRNVLEDIPHKCSRPSPCGICGGPVA